MNKEWSELNKTLQTQLQKESTDTEGIATLFDLRKQLMDVLLSFDEELNREDFNAIPFINAKGYHCKTISYSIWLIQMPFSRHWIMHIEACLRIKNKIATT